MKSDNKLLKQKPLSAKIINDSQPNTFFHSYSGGTYVCPSYTLYQLVYAAINIPIYGFGRFLRVVSLRFDSA